MIDRVHGVSPKLPEIPLINMGQAIEDIFRRADAWFSVLAEGEDAVAPGLIAVRLDVAHRRFKTLHEIGHFLDAFALPSRGFSSLAHPELDRWRVAVGESRAYRDLLDLSRAVAAEHRERLLEALRLDEVWARSYAQFVASRCRDPSLHAEVAAVSLGRAGEVYYPLQWKDRDFTAIEAAIVALFERLGWMA